MSPIVIVGAGIAGLTAALTLSRAGAPVRILDRGAPGGRARSQLRSEHILNLGPHALYSQGSTLRWLRSQGIHLSGGDPLALGQHAWVDEALAELPSTPIKLLSTPLLAGGRMPALSRLLRRPKEVQSVADWLAPLPPRPRSLLTAFCRLSTYASDLSTLDAQQAFDQLQLGTQGVRYLDGGWQSLVDALVSALEEEGVRVEKATVSHLSDRGVHSDLGTLSASEVIVATPPAVARKLTGLPLPTQPSGSACLDIALGSRPDGPAFVLDLDAPRYASMHSDSADLGPGAVLHLMAYLGPEDTPSRADLERWADALYPGWRDHVLHARWAPRLMACGGLPEPGTPRPAVRQRPGLLLGIGWAPRACWRTLRWRALWRLRGSPWHPWVARMLDRSPEAVRGLLFRARKALRQHPLPELSAQSTQAHQAALLAFGAALRQGDLRAAAALLSPEVEFHSDGFPHYPAAGMPLLGAKRVLAAVHALFQRGGEIEFQVVDAHGTCAVKLTALNPKARHAPAALWGVVLDGEGRIARMTALLDPERLGALTE